MKTIQLFFKDLDLGFHMVKRGRQSQKTFHDEQGAVNCFPKSH